MKRTIIIRQILVAGVLLLTGCSKSLHTGPFPNLKDPNDGGVVYYLPKVVLRATISYSVISKTTLRHGVATTADPTCDVNDVKLEEVVIADKDRAFIIDGSDIANSMMMDSNIDVQLYDRGFLKSVGVDATDKTRETVETLVSAGIRVAKMAAKAETDKVITHLQNIADKFYEDIADVTLDCNDCNDAERAAKLAPLNGGLDILLSTISKYAEANKTTSTPLDLEYVTVIDPNKMEEVGGLWTIDIPRKEVGKEVRQAITKKVAQVLGRPIQHPKDGAAYSVPTVTLTFDINDYEINHMRGKGKISRNKVSGLYYRTPIPIMIDVGTNKKHFGRHIVRIPQMSRIAWVPVKTKRMAKRNANLAFSSETGCLTGLTYESASSADKAAKSLEESLGKIEEAINNIKKERTEEDK